MVFKIADENGMLLLDLKDLRSMLQYVADNADQFKTQYGNVSAASAGAIQRNLLALESQGADKFFGEPALDLDDLIQTQNGRGVVNILAAEKLMQQSPKVYATFLLWLLSELFERLPEIGDPEKPKLVFFFDEAHLLFADIEKARRREDRTNGPADSFERRRRLFRQPESARYSGRCSRAAGQSRAACVARFHAARSKSGHSRGADVPAESKAQSGNRSDRAGVGEALVSMLDEDGKPAIVERARIVPPRSQVGRDHAGAAQADHSVVSCRRALRESGRSRIGLRKIAGTGRQKAETQGLQPTAAAPSAPDRLAHRSSARSDQFSNRPSDRAARFMIPSPPAWPRVRCGRPAARWAARSCADLWVRSLAVGGRR